MSATVGVSDALASSLVLVIWGRVIAHACGEPGVYIPPMELRTVPFEQTPFALLPGREGRVLPAGFQSQVAAHPVPPHAVKDSALSATDAQDVAVDGQKSPHGHEAEVGDVHDFLDAIGLEGHRPTAPDASGRAVETARDHAPYYSHYPLYPPHEYWQPPPYHDPYAYPPAPPSHPAYHPYVPPPPPPPTPPVKPLLPALAKPVALPTLKEKLPVLLGLVQAALSGNATGAALGGVSGLLGGALQPLLAGKRNLKGLIGKLSVPLIVLVLVNLELLALTWWLWEDCGPAPSPALPAAAAPATAPPTHADYYYRAAARAATSAATQYY